MCGITGTIFTKILNVDSRVDPFSTLEKITDSHNLSHYDINEIYNFSVKYKSDINFINYFESKVERTAIKKIVQSLKQKYASFNKNSNSNIDHNEITHSLEDKDKILDSIWFLEDELSNRYDFVKEYMNQKKKYSKFLKM